MYFACIVMGGRLIQEGKYHRTARVLVFACIVLLFALSFRALELSMYAQRGVPLAGLRIMSDVVTLMADSIMLALLLCLAEGWTLVRRKLPVSVRLRIAIIVTVYVCCGVAALVWKAVGLDAAVWVTGSLDSPPATLLLALRIGAAALFYVACIRTRDEFKLKKKFYSKFAFAFACLLALPVLTALCLWAFVPDDRRGAAFFITEVLCSMASQALLTLMFTPRLPHSLNFGFPFHAAAASAL